MFNLQQLFELVEHRFQQHAPTQDHLFLQQQQTAERGFTPLCQVTKHAMLRNAAIVTNREWG